MIEKTLKLKDIEKLLDEQTKIILSAVDEKISKLERRITKLEIKVEKGLTSSLLPSINFLSVLLILKMNLQ